MLLRKLTNRFKDIYCASAYTRQSAEFSDTEKVYATTFYDVEGDYAFSGKSKPCFESLEKILDLEESLGIKSTYNVVAKLAAQAPDLFRDMQSSGQEIASHSYDHKLLTSLSRSARRENIYNVRSAFDSLGLNVIGHRSPQSMWNLHVLKLLKEFDFVWNAENGVQPTPYQLPVSAFQSKNTIWRMPVAIDDWCYEGSNMMPDQVLETWKSYVNNHSKCGTFFSIGFHPWIEAPDDRFEVFAEFMSWLSSHPNIKLMPFGEAVKHMKWSSK